MIKKFNEFLATNPDEMQVSGAVKFISVYLSGKKNKEEEYLEIIGLANSYLEMLSNRR